MLDMSHSVNDIKGVGGSRIEVPSSDENNDGTKHSSSGPRDELTSSGLASSGHDLPTELPPFSFRKKPIMYSNTHSRSNISDLIPSGSTRQANRAGSLGATSDASGASSSSTTSVTSTHSTTSTNATSTTSSIVFKDFDYDEQIRAPRMANPTTAAAIIRRGEEESENTHPLPPYQNHSEQLPVSKEPSSKYHPAIFDLTKPTRRFSVPEVQEEDDFILNYTTNNYIYDKQTTITFSSNFHGGRIRNQPSIGNISHAANELSTVTSNDHLKCMYELKKPMGMPAVLRPNNTTTSTLHSHVMLSNNNNNNNNSNTEPALPNHSLVLEQVSTLSSPLDYGLDSSLTIDKNSPSTSSMNTSQVHDTTVPASRYPMSPELEAVRTNSTSISLFASTGSTMFDGPAVEKVVSHDAASNLSDLTTERKQSFSGEVMLEPTHIHWKPQNEFCMKCFEPFGLLRRRRRHHCRFCGLLICSYCLQETSLEPNMKASSRVVAYGRNKDGKQRPTVARGNSSRSIQDVETSVPKGILLDNQARFVIPINNAIDVYSYFKVSKVCKNCGELYGKLLSDVRQQRLPFNYVFIENPFVKKKRATQGVNLKMLQGERGQSVVVLTNLNGNGSNSANISTDLLTPSTTTTSSNTIVTTPSEGDPKHTNTNNDGILTDWTWSSF